MNEQPDLTGLSIETPVIIEAEGSESGVAAEYEWIEARYGRRDRAWRFVRQKLTRGPAGQWLDVIEIKLTDGREIELYFDISSFFGAFDAMDSEGDEDGITIGDIFRKKDPSR